MTACNMCTVNKQMKLFERQTQRLRGRAGAGRGIARSVGRLRSAPVRRLVIARRGYEFCAFFNRLYYYNASYTQKFLTFRNMAAYIIVY